MSNRPAEAARGLEQAYKEALAFQPGRATALILTGAQASACAEQEAAFPTVAIDENGMSTGMRLALLQPVQNLAAEWRALLNNFEIAIQPKMADIKAVQRLQFEASDVVKKRDEDLEAKERELHQDSKYEQIDDHHSRSKALFDSFRDKHSNRNAVMFSRNPLYWLLLILVLLTECFINYTAFEAFWGVPAVAFGTTVILGVLLALAAHGHGEILKQWSFRFGAGRDPAMRNTDWRMLGMSTGALIIVLAFTGWARWAYAIDSIGSQHVPSALGSIGVVQIDPLRDVLVSLIANIGAWMVGVIFSYLAHDPDPDYMAATSQFKKARKAWNHARKSHSVQLKYIEAQAAKSVEEKTKAAETRRKAVTQEFDMLEQVERRGEAVTRELEQVLSRNIDVYRDALVKVALANKSGVQLLRAGGTTAMSPFEYKSMVISPPSLSRREAA